MDKYGVDSEEGDSWKQLEYSKAGFLKRILCALERVVISKDYDFLYGALFWEHGFLLYAIACLLWFSKYQHFSYTQKKGKWICEVLSCCLISCVKAALSWEVLIVIILSQNSVISFRQCYYLRLCLCPSQTDVFIYMSDLNRKTKGTLPMALYFL